MIQLCIIWMRLKWMGGKSLLPFQYYIGHLRFWLKLLAVLMVAACAGCIPMSRTIYPTYTPTPITPTPTPTITPVWFPPTSTPVPPATPTSIPPTSDPRPPYGALIYTDTFRTPADWTARQVAGGSAAFGKNELSLAITGNKLYLYSLRLRPVLVNFYAEITVTLVFCSGVDEYGLLLRADSAINYYRVGFSCDGRARLDRIEDSGAASILDWQYGSGIPLGGPSITRLAVWAREDQLGVLSNGRLVFTLKDPKFSSGGLGVYARSSGSQPVTVNFSDLSVWEITP